MGWLDRVYRFLNPEESPQVAEAGAAWAQQLPTLWLLGKTGAGKSTLIQVLTGDSRAEIGNGFRPCTQSSSVYDFPLQQPLLRFLDTRGLAEAGYSATEDIASLGKGSHAVLVVMNTGETDQQVVLDALKQIRANGTIKQLLLVQTCSTQFEPGERDALQGLQRQQLMAVWPDPLDWVAVDFVPDAGCMEGYNELVELLCKRLPMVSLVVQQQQRGSREEQQFLQYRREILWYAGSAGAADALPALGLVAVPAVQGRMLYRLASYYGSGWSRQQLAEFVGTLGAGFSMQYLGSLGARQLGKLIPVYGQTVGAATSAALSFASSYAIGRVACYYLYQRQHGQPVEDTDIQALYREAFRSIKRVTDHDNAD